MTKCETCYHKKVCIDSANYRNAENCRQYKDKSLIVELPCRVGDTVYIHYELPFNEIRQTRIDRIDIHKEFTQVIFLNGSELSVWDNDWSVYKNAVFLSREDAERALKEREKK